MIFNVDFSECTSEIDVDFGELSVIKDGYTQDAVDKLVADATADGVEQGRKAEYNAFWDVFQKNGERTDYGHAFRSSAWNNHNFKPKYSMNVARKPEYMFSECGVSGDLEALLQSLGVELDFSGATEFSFTFYKSCFTRIGTVDCSNATRIYNLFNYSGNLKTIDEVILPDAVSPLSSFSGLKALENLKITGNITGAFDIKEALLLSKSSITSVVNALAASTSGLTATFSLAAVNNAFETSQGAADGSASEEWLSLVATKPSWTISLA